MKKIQLLLFAAIASLLMYACNNDEGNKTTENKDPGNTDTTSTGSTNHNNVDNDDADFLSFAASSGMKEVEEGKLAQSKGQSKEVKDLANMMVTDHTAMGEKVKALAATKNVQLPAGLSEDDKEKLSNDGKKTGKEFDREYAADMVDDHEKAITRFEDAAKNSKDADIKTLANEALPKLRHHLEMSKSTKEKVKG